MSSEGPVDTFAVLTVDANALVKPLHDRMPAILSREHFGAWLDPKESCAKKLLPLLAVYPAERMERWPISERVNSVNADGAGLLAKVEEPSGPSWTLPSLFDGEAA